MEVGYDLLLSQTNLYLDFSFSKTVMVESRNFDTIKRQRQLGAIELYQLRTTKQNEFSTFLFLTNYLEQQL